MLWQLHQVLRVALRVWNPEGGRARGGLLAPSVVVKSGNFEGDLSSRVLALPPPSCYSGH